MKNNPTNQTKTKQEEYKKAEGNHINGYIKYLKPLPH